MKVNIYSVIRTVEVLGHKDLGIELRKLVVGMNRNKEDFAESISEELQVIWEHILKQEFAKKCEYDPDEIEGWEEDIFTHINILSKIYNFFKFKKGAKGTNRDKIVDEEIDNIIKNQTAFAVKNLMIAVNRKAITKGNSNFYKLELSNDEILKVIKECGILFTNKVKEFLSEINK